MKTATNLIRRSARILIVGLIGLLPAFTTSTQAQAQSKSMADLNVRLGVPYTQAATENGPMTLALDFYAPKGACTVQRPTMVMIHGGGFKTGDRNSRRWK